MLPVRTEAEDAAGQGSCVLLMKTHEITVRLMCNPHGHAWTTLAVTELDEMGGMSFTYGEKVKAEYSIEELSAFVAAFTEVVVKDSSFAASERAIRVDVQEFAV